MSFKTAENIINIVKYNIIYNSLKNIGNDFKYNIPEYINKKIKKCNIYVEYKWRFCISKIYTS